MDTPFSYEKRAHLLLTTKFYFGVRTAWNSYLQLVADFTRITVLSIVIVS